MEDDFEDPIGPGTPAWGFAETAIYQGLHGSQIEKQGAIDDMTRELLAHGASASDIREWETYIETNIANKSIDANGEWTDSTVH